MKILMFLAIAAFPNLVFANEIDDLALDAASKYSQIGSKQCVDLSKNLKIISADLKENGPHVEVVYKIKSKQFTYKVEIFDGTVTAVKTVDLGDGG